MPIIDQTYGYFPNPQAPPVSIADIIRQLFGGGPPPPSGGGTTTSGGGGGTSPGPAVSPVAAALTAADYRKLAAARGITLSDPQVNALLSGRVSAAEFAVRLQVIDRVKSMGGFFDAFETVIRDRNLAPNFDIMSFDARKNFILGLAPRKLYTAYGEAVAESQAQKVAKGQTTANDVLKNIATALQGVPGAQGHFTALLQGLHQIGFDQIRQANLPSAQGTAEGAAPKPTFAPLPEPGYAQPGGSPLLPGTSA
jgi:hypothetical protein